jgi:hypothetical protein
MNTATISESSHSYYIVLPTDETKGRVGEHFTQTKKDGPLITFRLSKKDTTNEAIVGTFRFN